MSALWRLLDPLLLRLRARLEHLDAHQPSARFERQLRAAGTIADSVRFFATAAIDNPFGAGAIVIGESTAIHGLLQIDRDGGRIAIGHHSYVGPESRIVSRHGITIGNYVLISHVVDIIDNQSHSLDWRERRDPKSERVDGGPIVIEDDVWIGAKATILKGVRIGRGAIVGANSVVNEDVAPFTLVAGNPARVIRELARDGLAE